MRICEKYLPKNEKSFCSDRSNQLYSAGISKKGPFMSPFRKTVGWIAAGCAVMFTVVPSVGATGGSTPAKKISVEDTLGQGGLISDTDTSDDVPAKTAVQPAAAQAQPAPTQAVAAQPAPATQPAQPASAVNPAPAQKVATSAAVSAQTVTGLVSDLKTGLPVANAPVIVKGTTVSATTDAAGRYMISVPDAKNATLLVGGGEYGQREVVLAGKTSLDVKLSKDVLTLEKDVVVGYGTTKKSAMTGSVSSVDTKELSKTSSVSVEKALQGKVAGVNVTQNSGAPGKGMTIRIRGVGTINGSDPLYVVDGVPTSSIENLGPEDIASISILKDASSAAIYGSRGLNGVVLVTTKKGKEGTAQIAYDGYVGIQNFWKKPKLCTAREWATLYNEAQIHGGADSSALIPLKGLGAGTNWFNQISNNNVVVQSHNVSVSGGSDKISYFLSGLYSGQQGLIKGSDYQKFGSRLNVDAKVRPWFTLGDNFDLASQKTDRANETDEWNSAMATAMQMDPTVTPYDKNGDYNSSAYMEVPNPVAVVNTYHRQDKELDISNKASATASLHDILKYNASFGVDITNVNENRFSPTYSVGSFTNSDAIVVRGSSKNVEWILENTLAFNKNLADVHDIKLLVGATAQGNDNDTTTAQGSGTYSNDSTQWQLDATLDPAGAAVDGRLVQDRMLSYFGRLDYALFDRYFIEASVRADGSSRFAKENRWGYFPAVSASWRVSKERFMSPLKAISELKLRGGYGVLGNNNIGEYRYMTIFENGQNYPFDGVIKTGTIATSEGTSNIKWERQASSNIGFDLGLFEDRAIFTTDFYSKKTTDMLCDPTIPGQVGDSAAPWVNAGEMSNKGFESVLEIKNEIRDFSFDLSGNIAVSRNRVDALGVGNQPILEANVQGIAYVSRTAVGHSVGEFYGYKCDGLFQTQKDIDNYVYKSGPNKGQMVQPDAVPGDIRYVHDDNGLVQDFIGNPNPKFIYGFNADFGLAGFDLSFCFQGSYGNKIFNAARWTTENSAVQANLDSKMLGRWTAPGTTNDPNMQRLSTNDPSGMKMALSDRFVEDGSYLRMKSVQLGYTIPNEVTSKFKVSKIRFYIGVENLWTFTHYSGLDPEVGVGEDDGGDGVKNVNLTVGVDRGVYPQARSFNAGLNITL